MMSHTPGPWHIGNIVGGRFVFAADGYAVADATVYHRNHDDQHLANARLIALAPEMLEALYQYRSDMRYPPEADSRERRIELIEALIARATGAQVPA